MKKLFYTLFATLLFATACSSGDPIVDPVDPVSPPEVVMHKVNLNVQRAEFSAVESPVRSTSYQPTVAVFYEKESGKMHSYIPVSLGKVTLELPEGEYFVAIMNDDFSGMGLDRPMPSNYFTDQFGGGLYGAITGLHEANFNNYLGTFDLSVPNNNGVVNVVLEPMWSSVEVIFEDLENTWFPHGATLAYVDLLPAHVYYNLATKEATYDAKTHERNGSVRAISPQGLVGTDHKSLQFYISKTAKINNEMKLKFDIYKGSPVEGKKVEDFISSHIIPLNVQVENGKKYVVRGKLGDVFRSDSDLSLNITLGGFEDQEVEIKF